MLFALARAARVTIEWGEDADQTCVKLIMEGHEPRELLFHNDRHGGGYTALSDAIVALGHSAEAMPVTDEFIRWEDKTYPAPVDEDE